jgi:hypothetical protein
MLVRPYEKTAGAVTLFIGSAFQLRCSRGALGIIEPPDIFAGRTNHDYRERDTYMGGNENDGYYCTICGGIPPDKITTKRVLIDGKETGIDHLDWIFGEVAKLAVENDTVLSGEILKRVKQFNYVPTKKTAEYAAGLLAAYKQFRAENP